MIPQQQQQQQQWPRARQRRRRRKWEADGGAAATLVIGTYSDSHRHQTGADRIGGFITKGLPFPSLTKPKLAQTNNASTRYEMHTHTHTRTRMEGSGRGAARWAVSVAASHVTSEGADHLHHHVSGHM
eukprot:GHVU01034944.1.p2 GENE.GHVU01034944.1~~GHVU01034944.1.p2  ORF type:complete len:128 (+),score=20.74 GHVU01034944.1:164-547(+)